jgi:hypothetical protein
MHFGVCAGPTDKYDTIAAPARRGHDVTVLRDQRSIAETYNTILDRAAAEPVVLLHDDVEICDRSFVEKITSAVAERDVAIVGVIGSRNSTRVSWHWRRAAWRLRGRLLP